MKDIYLSLIWSGVHRSRNRVKDRWTQSHLQVKKRPNSSIMTTQQGHKMQDGMGWDTLQKRRLDNRFCIMYKIGHHRVDVEKEKYLQSGDSRTRGGHKFYEKRTTREAYRNSFFPRTVIHCLEQVTIHSHSNRILGSIPRESACHWDPPATDSTQDQQLYRFKNVLTVHGHLGRQTAGSVHMLQSRRAYNIPLRSRFYKRKKKNISVLNGLKTKQIVIFGGDETIIIFKLLNCDITIKTINPIWRVFKRWDEVSLNVFEILGRVFWDGDIYMCMFVSYCCNWWFVGQIST